MYVITGATGNTGSVAAKRLLEQGKKVRVIGRSAEKLKALAAEGAEPFVANVSDGAALTKAFTGAEAVYAMVPPDLAAKDVKAYRKGITDAYVQAITGSGVKHVVTLSSIGADKPDRTGPVVGLHELEERFNSIPGLNVLHLRAGYFMENTLSQVTSIKTIDKTTGPVRPDLKLPLIATKDIGAEAASALLRLDFQGHQTRELQGQRDLNYNEITAIIGKAIGKPDLEYVQVPDAQLRPILIHLGMSENMADMLLEMAGALNSGHMMALEPRTAQNTTPTSFEAFVKEEFVPAYRGKSQAA